MTNFEKIKQMSAEDFANFIDLIIDSLDHCICCKDDPLTCKENCYNGRIDWLESEAEENDSI